MTFGVVVALYCAFIGMGVGVRLGGLETCQRAQHPKKNKRAAAASRRVGALTHFEWKLLQTLATITKEKLSTIIALDLHTTTAKLSPRKLQ